MELTEKVYDFAVTQRNGLCSLVVEECLTEIMTHTITILHFIVCGPDVACILLATRHSNVMLKCANRFTFEPQMCRKFRGSLRKAPVPDNEACFNLASLSDSIILKKFYNVIHGIVPSFAFNLITVRTPSGDAKEQTKAEILDRMEKSQFTVV